MFVRFVDLEKAFDRISRRVTGVISKKGLPEILVKAVMNLYEGTKTLSWIEAFGRIFYKSCCTPRI